jgi:hypothetical protein
VARAARGGRYSRERTSLFHCDPHAGNLFLTDEGRLAILDWSLVGILQKRERIAMTQIILAALTLNGQKVAALVASLAQRGTVDRAVLDGIVRDRLQQVQRGQLPGLSWVIGLLDDASQRAGLRVSTDLMLLRKSLLTLAGVVTELAGDETTIDAVVLGDFVGHFIAELPRRWPGGMGSRDFVTRVSNADLLEFAAGLPLYLRVVSSDTLTVDAFVTRTPQWADPRPAIAYGGNAENFAVVLGAGRFPFSWLPSRPHPARLSLRRPG